MQLTIDHTLSNGMWDIIQEANAKGKIGGFIFGALDKGWTVSVPGSIEAKYGQWAVYVHHCGPEDALLYFVYGNKKIAHEVPLSTFQWKDVQVKGSRLWIGQHFIINAK